MRTMR